MWSIDTVEYYSAIQKDEILPFPTTRMNLENSMLGKISQTEKVKNHMIILICGIKHKATNEQTSKTKQKLTTHSMVVTSGKGVK